MKIPNAETYNSDPEYITSLVLRIKERRGLSQRAIARQMGVGFTSIKSWMTGVSKPSYPAQYALEVLAEV